MLDSLDRIRRALTASLPNPSMFGLINTRLILRTGVDLAAFNSEINTHPETVSMVLGALQEMGYSLEGKRKE
jgi:hypothetical protein